MDKQLFKQIFSDAHVVDLDLSQWDEGLVLYVLADHVERVEGERKALFAVEFRRLSKLQLQFPHLNTEPLPTGEHFQWMIDDFTMNAHGEQTDVALWGLAGTPRIELSCGDIQIRAVELRILDELVPGWDDPSMPFARPSLEVLSKMFARPTRDRKR